MFKILKYLRRLYDNLFSIDEKDCSTSRDSKNRIDQFLENNPQK